VFAVVVGALDVGGTYTGALVLPELPLVVAPQATLPITLTSATIRITADIGSLLPASRQTRSTSENKATSGPPLRSAAYAWVVGVLFCRRSRTSSSSV